jgi:hypothetical protein
MRHAAPHRTIPRRIALALTAGALAIVGPLALVGPTSAAGPAATIKAKLVTVNPGSLGEASVSCGSGQRVLGGGVVQSGNPDGVWLRASGPLDATGVTAQTRSGDIAKQWYGAVFNDSGLQRLVKVFAICAPSSNAIIKAKTFTVGSQMTGQASVACGKDRRVLGGGVVQQGPAHDDQWLRASGPRDASGSVAQTVTGDVAKQWLAVVENGGDTTQTFKVFAICAKGSTATLKVVAFDLFQGLAGDASVGCGTKRRVLGGGMLPIGSAATLWLRASGPLDASGITLDTVSGDVPRQFYAAASDFNVGEQQLKVLAICG